MIKRLFRRSQSIFPWMLLLFLLCACSVPDGSTASAETAAPSLSMEAPVLSSTFCPSETAEPEPPSTAPVTSVPTEPVPETTEPEVLLTESFPMQLRIFVLEFDPVLETVWDPELYPENDGHPRVSQFFGQNAEQTLGEIVRDLEDASHGSVEIVLDRIWLNEFPTYTTLVNRTDGSRAHSFDEATYLDRIGFQGGSTGDWFRLWDEGVLDDVGSYTFDYEGLLDRFDLAERRNRGEFDQVWLLTIDPASTYETLMVGRSAYWINGVPYIRDCSNFILLNVSISRPDANLHALGHGMEGLLNHVFPVDPGSDYREGSYHVPDRDSYFQLNDWQKFLLGSRNNADSELSGVGDVHFPFNGAYDYDYTNYVSVPSNWQEWEHYPELTGEFVPSNCRAWLDHEINRMLGPEDCMDPDRLYMRFWFSMMPHVEGRNAEGYSRNWWLYFCTADQVTALRDPNADALQATAGKAVPVHCTITWASGKTETLTRIRGGDNLHIENPEVLELRDGLLYAKAPGSSELRYDLDGQSILYRVTVTEHDPG